MHRNSQKRIYIPNRAYFITTSTLDRFPYFREDKFCELLVVHLELCKMLYGIIIYGYKINPDHIHLLLSIGDKVNISTVMNSLKGNFSRDVNRMIQPIEYDTFEGDIDTFEGDPPVGRLQSNRVQSNRVQSNRVQSNRVQSNRVQSNRVQILYDKFYIRVRHPINEFIINHNNIAWSFTKKFQWQKSYYDHYIRDDEDFYNHLHYIQNQWIKHELKENKFCYIMDGLL